MICKKCGTNCEEKMRFCTKCGTPLDKNDSQEGSGQSKVKSSVSSAFGPAAAAPAPAASEPAKKPSVLPFVLPAAGLLLLSVILFAVFGPKKELSAEAAAEESTVKTFSISSDKNNDRAEADDAEAADEESENLPTATPGVQKKINVIVNDANGPVVGADVELIDENGEYVRTVATKENGIATMTMVGTGTYVLHIAKKDYAEINETITMDENTLAYDLALERTLERLTTTLTIRTARISDNNVLGSVNVALIPGQDASEGEAYVTGTTDESGVCTFEVFPYGEFTLTCDSELYCPLIKNIDVNEENGHNEYTVYLVPVPKEGEAYVVLDWDDSALDLDLCAFHSDLREYVNIAHPRNQKNSYLYADNDGASRVEAIMIKDAGSAAAQTIYVMDTTTALADSRTSSMGANGAYVTVYRRDQAPVTYTMSRDEKSLVWTVCTIQSGEVEDAAQYSSTVSDFIWAVDIIESKKPEPTPEARVYDDEDEDEDY